LITVDLEHRLILNAVTLPAILLALLLQPFYAGTLLALCSGGGATGFIITYLVRF
jgi:prepilin signal peptidase PulO-like enzyme (type II secretory pathway)